jgi:glycosyltransferase involved in cell wall biosynthesis
VTIVEKYSKRRRFAFQLFYPTSRFFHKRADLAMNAAAAAVSKSKDTGLVITTESDMQGELKGVMQVGRITRSEVYEWFAGSDALLFTSERETLGLPLLEALEFGLPVIAPRLPYAMEILSDAGCYFDQPTPASVVSAIENCRQNYELWRVRSIARCAQLRSESKTWIEHWLFFMKQGGDYLHERVI